MNRRPQTLVWLAGITLFMSQNLWAATYHAGATGGLMLQPSSNYYHAVNGGFFEVGTDNHVWIGRISYLERPRFEANGFHDQEFRNLAMLGTQVRGTKFQRLRAYFGGGEMHGFVKKVHPEDESRYVEAVRYEIRGFAAAIEYSLILKSVTFAIDHQMFIGLPERRQLESYVGWPYNFFLLRIGYEI